MRIMLTTTDSAMMFMRRAGYGYQKEGSGQLAFIRRVGSGEFPRFHAYVTEGTNPQPQTPRTQIAMNLHVDQKAPTYGRNSAHSGEYDGPTIEQEAARLRALTHAGTDEHEQGEGEPPERTGGFLRRLFG